MTKPIFCFDIDGTLISTKGAGFRSFKKAAESIFDRRIDWKQISMAGRLDPSIFREALKLMQIEYLDSHWEAFRQKYLECFREELNDTSQWVVFEGVFPLLEELTARGFKTILLTGNIREGAQIKLDAVKLSRYFDFDGSIFGDAGEEHRDELAYEFREKYNSSSAVVIGDTPADIRVGKIIGGVSAAVATGMHSLEELGRHEPEILLSSLKDFPLENYNH